MLNLWNTTTGEAGMLVLVPCPWHILRLLNPSQSILVFSTFILLAFFIGLIDTDLCSFILGCGASILVSAHSCIKKEDDVDDETTEYQIDAVCHRQNPSNNCCLRRDEPLKQLSK